MFKIKSISAYSDFLSDSITSWLVLLTAKIVLEFDDKNHKNSRFIGLFKYEEIF